jgi:hypothetical protein
MAAEAELLREAAEERLEPEAVDAVLAIAGDRLRQRPRELPAGLTERELGVNWSSGSRSEECGTVKVAVSCSSRA